MGWERDLAPEIKAEMTPGPLASDKPNLVANSLNLLDWLEELNVNIKPVFHCGSESCVECASTPWCEGPGGHPRGHSRAPPARWTRPHVFHSAAEADCDVWPDTHMACIQMLEN